MATLVPIGSHAPETVDYNTIKKVYDRAYTSVLTVLRPPDSPVDRNHSIRLSSLDTIAPKVRDAGMLQIAVQGVTAVDDLQLGAIKQTLPAPNSIKLVHETGGLLKLYIEVPVRSIIDEERILQQQQQQRVRDEPLPSGVVTDFARPSRINSQQPFSFKIFLVVLLIAVVWFSTSFRAKMKLLYAVCPDSVKDFFLENLGLANHTTGTPTTHGL